MLVTSQTSRMNLIRAFELIHHLNFFSRIVFKQKHLSVRLSLTYYNSWSFSWDLIVLRIKIWVKHNTKSTFILNINKRPYFLLKRITLFHLFQLNNVNWLIFCSICLFLNPFFILICWLSFWRYLTAWFLLFTKILIEILACLCLLLCIILCEHFKNLLLSPLLLEWFPPDLIILLIFYLLSLYHLRIRSEIILIAVRNSLVFELFTKTMH